MKGEFHRLCRPRIISLKRLKRKKKKGEERKNTYIGKERRERGLVGRKTRVEGLNGTEGEGGEGKRV